MPSAMFLAVQHDCGPMDKSAGTGPKNEEKREKMKRTLWVRLFSLPRATPADPAVLGGCKRGTFALGTGYRAPLQEKKNVEKVNLLSKV